MNINILLHTVSTLNLVILRLESIVHDKQNVWERLYFMLFLISFSKLYFSCQIESIWIIIVLLFNLGKIFFSCCWNSWWDEKCRFFSGLLDWIYSGLSIVICHYLGKQSVADSGIASNCKKNTVNNFLLKKGLSPSVYFCTSNI